MHEKQKKNGNKSIKEKMISYPPVQFPRDVNVIHEALDVEWQV